MLKIYFTISISILLVATTLSLVLSAITYKKNRILKSFNVLFFGVVFATLCMFLPINIQSYGKEHIIRALLVSFIDTLGLFIINGDYSSIMTQLETIGGTFATAYSYLAIVLFIVAPVLTFGVVLSFFKNVASNWKYRIHFFSEIYVFSALTPKTLTLAKSLKKNNKKRVVIFADVFERDEETVFEQIEAAHEIGAIIFKDDITVIDLSIHSKKKSITLFCMTDDETDNINQALLLIDKYKERENTSLYVSATNIESELMLSTKEAGNIKIRRVNETRSLVSRLLYEDGIHIFESAIPHEEDEKKITAVVVGLGAIGTEMAKALPWFCQMDGYRVEIHLIDMNPNAESKMKWLCPELMDEKHNGDFETEGEAHYKITVHSGVDTETFSFWETLSKISDVTYVLVALGNDEKNIRTAVTLRSWFEKEGMNPQIDTAVYDTEKKNALQGIQNYSGQAYNINFIGDLATSYSEEVILNSNVEEAALARHLKWGKEEEFWKYEYNYRSSIASAIHKKMKILCKIPGADLPPNERNEDEKIALRILEHRRWNAYIRSEGYVYGEKRNNLAKVHHCLVPFEQLSEKEQKKDDD